MFILETDQIPGTADALTAAIADSIRQSIHLPAGAAPVKMTGSLPTLSTVTIDVSNGAIDSKPPLGDAAPADEQSPGPGADSFDVVGDPIVMAGVPAKFALSAKNVLFAYARGEAGRLIANLKEASDGHLSVELGQRQLETAILSIAQRFAASSGVAISNVQATLASVSPTELNVLLNITAKKFVTAVIRVSGRLSINNELVATATNLKADADGMVGGIAVGFLRPHLQKLEGKPLPLMAFSLGNVKLRGVEVHTDSGLRISASFGSEAR